MPVPVLERLWRVLDRQRGARRFAMEVGAPGPVVLETLAELVGNDASRRALDPWATNGVTLTFAVESGLAGSGVGLLRGWSTETLTSELSVGLAVEWEFEEEQGTALALGRSEYAPLCQCGEQSFDLVVSMPLWGIRWDGRPVPRAFQRDPVREVLLAAWSRPTPDGVGTNFEQDAEVVGLFPDVVQVLKLISFQGSEPSAGSEGGSGAG
jgi:hypothetical protein